MRLGVAQQRFFLRDVQARGYAAVVARIDQVESFLQGLDGAIQDSDFAVEFPQRKIIARQFRSDHQAHIFKIGGAGLVGRFRGFDAAAAFAEKIDFVAGDKGNGRGILIDGVGRELVRRPRDGSRTAVAGSIVGVVPG